MTLEERVEKLERNLKNYENLVNHLSTMITGNKFYTDADINGVRYTNNEQQIKIADNTSDISDNRTAIEETFEAELAAEKDIADLRTATEETFEAQLASEEDIADLRTAVEEVYELLTEE